MQTSFIHRHLKSLMVQQGITQQQIADRLQISRQGVNNVLRGKANTARVREAICEMLGIKKEEIWP